ncbi:MAG: phosphate signaling complex protein PhoU [Egibacteraceae bacterium]
MLELRRNFHERLGILEDEVLGMGQRVLRMLADAMDALEGRGHEHARAVIDADDAVDATYRAVQEGALTTLALQAPVASELRLVSALIHVSIHLERVGDLCVSIARIALRSGQPTLDADVAARLAEMGTRARRALERCLHSFARRDVALARELRELGGPLARLNQGLLERLARLTCEMAETDEEQLGWAFNMVLVARCLERIGDHAVDIGQQAVFCVTGAVGTQAARGRSSP